MPDPRPPAGKRIRRTAEHAREAILDAAEQRLIQTGPAGIRLQEVASDVGVSHPTLLHHFGSREGLVDAVVARAFSSLQSDIVTAIGNKPRDESGMGTLMDRVFETMTESGHARVMAWLALEDVPTPSGTVRLDAVVKASHMIRSAKRQALGRSEKDPEDTAFIVLLAAFALFGEAIVGNALFESAGLPDGGPRFRAWLGKLILANLEGE